MFESWTLLKKPTSPTEHSEPLPRHVEVEVRNEPPRLIEGSSLDSVGQRSESVRDRVNALAERLHDLQTLSADFGQIIGPLNGFVDEHAASRAKLMEVEALLGRERELLQALRAEHTELQLSSARMAGEFQEATAALQDQTEMVRHQDTRITELRIRIADLKSHGEALDNRLFSETERSKALTEDNVVLRNEVAAAESACAQLEQQLAEAREIIGLSEAEGARLQHLTESLTHKVTTMSRTVSELDPQLQAAKAANVSLQSKLSAEHSARQKVEAARDAERSAYESELASLSMKNDGLSAHVVNTDKLLVHVREQQREKAEALRTVEKNLKDVLSEKATVERRLDVLLETSARSNAQLQEVQRTNADLKDRCDMLTKAVAAKDQLLESANRKATGLLERIEQLNARFQQERAEFEATHRRMIEELQNERAERSLAHGALDIARKSRSSVLAQYTALKRQTGTFNARAIEDEEDHEPKPPVASNVMAFNPSE